MFDWALSDEHMRTLSTAAFDHLVADTVLQEDGHFKRTEL
jgi:hypothetical protein